MTIDTLFLSATFFSYGSFSTQRLTTDLVSTFLQADVMVNTTNPEMDLECGAVSRSILAQAGRALQKECKKKYPKGIKTGDIAVTKGHGLRVKHVFHLALPDWQYQVGRG